LIDDHTPTPAHALFSWGRLWTCVTVCAVLWALAFVAYLLRFGTVLIAPSLPRGG
jgi:chromate transporter